MNRCYKIKQYLFVCFVLTCLWIIWFSSGLFNTTRCHTVNSGNSNDVVSKKSNNDVFDKSTPSNHSYALPTDERLFQSVEEVEFPSVHGNKHRIPHIIHQIFKDENIPQALSPLIKSFVRNNPDWIYMFWTYETGRVLIGQTHPYLLKAFDSFKSYHGVKKADLLRIVILYEFGGVYADMDVTNLRPLDIATKKYACIVPAEPFEHSAFYEKQYILTTAVMLCRPKHPFFKFVLQHLAETTDAGGPSETTGPLFMTRMFDAYNNITVHNRNSIKTDMTSNSPVFYKGALPETDNDAVYVPNSQYFMDTVNFEKRKQIESVCNYNTEKKTELIVRARFEYASRQQVGRNQKFTFTEHHWLHFWLYPTHGEDSIHEDTMPIHYIVTNITVYH